MTWKHVALIAIAAIVVLACEISITCQSTLDKVIGFSLAIVGAVAGNAMRTEETARKEKAP